MQTAISKDGTTLAYWRSGEGAPLLLVHGSTADHTTTWRFVLEDLARHFTVYAMDRRGRGNSSDSPDYDLQREAEDIAAVVEEIGGRVNVLGHSYGALCTLEAALITPNIAKMILYEGVPRRGADEIPTGLPDRLDAMVAAGDLDGVLMGLYRDMVGMTPEEIEMLRSNHAAWSVRRANARVLPRELRALDRYVFDPTRFVELTTATLLLAGETSPPLEQENAQVIVQSLPNAQLSILPNQAHMAMYADPALFVREVVQFLLS